MGKGKGKWGKVKRERRKGKGERETKERETREKGKVKGEIGNAEKGERGKEGNVKEVNKLQIFTFFYKKVTNLYFFLHTVKKHYFLY